ncbi:hypothetical protein [Bacillus sp. ISL-39]|uniref:hypothetical protein n=1 Tax=Bacillus sp. ISL-39 TaxID=2819124 RepID=UPI001BEBF474|nr:hypothetical protein [Bacillus sp. ISL-39]MBT2636732.1 hypothetical protein [Bacillus sp. ISL-39]
MRKIQFGIALIVIIVASAFLFSKKNNSFSTPEEALSNVKNPTLDVLEIIDTKLYDRVAYVFYYSEAGEIPKNYLAAAKIKKNKQGWRFDEIIGVGNIDQSNAGMISGKDDYIVGLAAKEVDKVHFGSLEAKLITMDKKDMKAFLFHGVEPDLMNQADFNYFDKEGNELPY